MHSAVPPERLIRAFEWGRGASTSVPNALDRVAGPQPRCDLLFALHKTGVRLALWSLSRPITDLGILAHKPVIGFGDPKYSQMRRFFFVGSAALCWNLLQLAERVRYSLRLCERQRYWLKLRETELRQISISRRQSR